MRNRENPCYEALGLVTVIVPTLSKVFSLRQHIDRANPWHDSASVCSGLGPGSIMDVPKCRALKVRETDRFAKTVSSRDAATEPARMHLRGVFANLSVSCVKLSSTSLWV